MAKWAQCDRRHLCYQIRLVSDVGRRNLHCECFRCLPCDTDNVVNKATYVNTLRPWQNGRHFPDDTFNCLFLNENACISINISLKFINMVRLPTHIFVTRPQWVKFTINDHRHRYIEMSSYCSTNQRHLAHFVQQSTCGFPPQRLGMVMSWRHHVDWSCPWLSWPFDQHAPWYVWRWIHKERRRAYSSKLSTINSLLPAHFQDPFSNGLTASDMYHVIFSH